MELAAYTLIAACLALAGIGGVALATFAFFRVTLVWRDGGPIKEIAAWGFMTLSTGFAGIFCILMSTHAFAASVPYSVVAG